MSIEKYLNKLFGNQGSDLDDQPEFRKVFDDSKVDSYLNQLGSELSNIHNGFGDQARALLGNNDVSNDYSVISQSGVRGIAHCKVEAYSLDVLKAYLLKLKKLHLSIGYVQKLSVHTLKEGKETYSYYLKPSIKLQSRQPAEQLYGNISLDLVLKESKPQQLKCVSTYYSDASFKEARSSEEWLSVIFLEEQFNL